MYFEFEVLANQDEGGVAQIGFAFKDGLQISDTPLDVGCGDNNTSWGLDGTLCLKWFDGEDEWPCRWTAGDVIGLATNMDVGKIAVSKNGNWFAESCGIVFEDDKIKKGVYPCLSGGRSSLRYAFKGKDFKYTLPSCMSVPEWQRPITYVFESIGAVNPPSQREAWANPVRAVNSGSCST